VVGYFFLVYASTDRWLKVIEMSGNHSIKAISVATVCR